MVDMTAISAQRPVAYFCAEYGIQADLPLYAGGLGVLAGDTVKEAADQNLPMVAIGLLYRGGSAIQVIDEKGWQTERDLAIDPYSSGFEHVYATDDPEQPLFVKVHLTKTDVWARIWKRTVNNTTLYLLDTDTDQNELAERDIARALYVGSDDDLLKQQLILGIGGVKLLTELKIEPALYHVNEGRPAFLYWQLIRRFMDEQKLSYQEAGKKAKSLIVYTNHTWVREGNQSYDADLLKSYALYYAEKMGVSIDELLSPGHDEETGKFNITMFALNNARKASAVSQAHFELSKNVWPEFDWVGITNAVHKPTWQDPEIRDCKLGGEELWRVHVKKKQELMVYAQGKTGFAYDPNRLVIGWARRFAGYKRPMALFEDMKRLLSLVKSQDKPVQIVMAGKAHASDTAAKKQLQQVIGHMQTALAGYALFIPNYDIDVAKMMVKGVDVWLNTPVLGQEASGTSGMKAIANGVIQLTVADGWAAEVDWTEYGWTLDSNHLAETLYSRLEKEIVPLFYQRNERGVPEGWLVKMKKSLELSKQFSADRMLNDYREKLYS